MNIIKKIIAFWMALCLILSVFSVSAGAVTAQVCIGDEICSGDASGSGWTLTASGKNFTLSLDSFHGLAMYENGCIAAYNCALQIVLSGENEIHCGYAEHNAPYSIYGIYAENATISVTGNGSMKLDTVRCPGALPIVLNNSRFEVNGGSLEVVCAEDAFYFEPGTVSFAEGTTSLNGVVVDENGIPIPVIPCEHADEDPMDGICDICGESVPFEPPVEPDLCPMAKYYEKHKNTLIWNFFVIFVHRIVHEFWLKKNNKSASGIVEVFGRVLQDAITLYSKGVDAR